MKPITLTAFIVLALVSSLVRSEDGERAFLLCDGASEKDSAQSFTFTVTLDMTNHQVINIGTGDGAITEAFTDSQIIGKHDLGGGVLNRLTIDRNTRTFDLAILRAKTANEGEAEEVDHFKGTCAPTGRAF